MTGLSTRLSLPALVALSSLTVAQNNGVTLVNGVDGYMDVPYSTAIVPQSGITVEAWITYDDSTLPSGWRYPTVVRQNHTAGGNEAYFLRIEADNSNSRRLRWKIETATNSVSLDWPFGAGQLNTWTHVAGTYDGTTSRLFVNGAEVASLPGNSTPIVDRGNESLRIGKGSDIGGPIEVWHGQLDEVRLWPFARTAGEIFAAKDYELSSIPGLVSTWNLNGSFMDTSGTQHGTGNGSIPFTANTLTLTPLLFPPAVAYGNSTPGCLGNLEISIASLPQPGNADFAVMCTTAPAGALAFGMASFRNQMPPLRMFGIDIHLDPVGAVLALSPVDGLGAVRMAVPVPSFVGAGLQLGFQIGVIDPCGPVGVTASNAVAVTLHP